MKILSKKSGAFGMGMLAAMFTSVVLATGGNGNEPPTTNERSGVDFCDKYSWVCFLTTSGTGGNGNEPPKDE